MGDLDLHPLAEDLAWRAVEMIAEVPYQVGNDSTVTTAPADHCEHLTATKLVSALFLGLPGQVLGEGQCVQCCAHGCDPCRVSFGAVADSGASGRLIGGT